MPNKPKSSDPRSLFMRMGLKNKLISIVIAVGTIPLILAMILSYHQGNKSLRQVIGSSFQALAFETSTKVDLLLKEEIHKITHLTSHPTLFLSVDEPSVFPGPVLSPETGMGIREQSQAWRDRKPQPDSPTTNRVSHVLRDFLKRDQYAAENTSGLFITNAKGILVSSINFHPQFMNTSLPSWKKIMSGKLETFIGPLTQDTRTEQYQFEIAVPIKNREGKVLGVLHRIYSAKNFFARFLDHITFGQTGHIMLISSDGTVLSCPILPTGHKLTDSKLVQAVTGPTAAWVKTEGDGHGSKDMSIIGYSPLEKTSQITLNSSNQRWYTFAWQSSDELFAPTQNLLYWIAGAGGFSILLIVVMGSLAANKIVRPIRQLQSTAKSIGRGETVEPLSIKTGDEIESLADEINTMSHLLKHTFSGLEEQVAARTQEVLFLKKYTEGILMSVPEVILIFDSEMKIEYANAAFENLIDSSDPANFMGRKLAEISLEFSNSWSLVGKELAAYKPGGESAHPKTTLAAPSYKARDPLNPSSLESLRDQASTVTLGGKTFAYQFFNVILEEKQGRRTGLIMQDITDEKALLDQLTQTDKLAGLGTLAAGIAHEINNPLYSVMAYTEAILEEKNLSKIQNFARKVLDRSKHMSAIILNLSGYVRSNEQDVVREVDINERLDAANEMARLASYSDSINLVKNYGNIPPIFAKPEEIQQVFLNIIHNSVQAMDGKGKLVITSKESNGTIVVQIRDTGPGIPQEHLSKVFDPFFTTREPGKGTGLGLNIVHRLVESYGGHLHIESKVGQGTMVEVSLPLNKKPENKEVIRGKTEPSI